MGTWLILLRPKIISLKHRLRKREGRSLLKPLVLAGLAAAFWVFTFLAFKRVLFYFRGVELFGDLLASNLLFMILLTFFSILLFSNIISSLSTFFLAEDLNLILSRPVPPDRVFYGRLAETLTHSSWMVLLFGLPVFLAYGWVYKASLTYYIVLVCALIPFLIIPAALGTLFSIMMVNIFPARRTKDVLFLLSIFFAVILYFMLRFLQPERLANPDSFASLVEYLTDLEAPFTTFLPSSWAAEALLPFYQDHRSPVIFFLGLLWSTAGAGIVFANWLFRAKYFDGWTKAQEARKARITQMPLVERFIRLATFYLHPRVRALVVKDCKTFCRDAAQWSQLILLAALVVVYLYNFSVLPLSRSPLPTFFLQNLISFLNMGLAGFVLAAVSGRFVFPAVSLEGPAFWIIRSSPISLRSFLRSKFWTSLFPLLILAQVLIFWSNHLLQVTPFMMILSSVTIFFMTFGVASLGIGMGAIYPRFRVENAAQIPSGFGGVFFMVMSMFFVGAIVILEAWPVYTIFMAGFNHRVLSLFEWTGIILSFASVAILIGVVAIVPMRMGLKKLSEMDF